MLRAAEAGRAMLWVLRGLARRTRDQPGGHPASCRSGSWPRRRRAGQADRADLRFPPGNRRRWRQHLEAGGADDGGGRGHGLPMMQTFMDYVALEPRAGGTTVRMSRIVR